ncbi:MAG TPA: hypothetical protein PLT66_09170, partial [Bacillota bacterium]|nr:hypothetical protein [Bacillota bacterium]
CVAGATVYIRGTEIDVETVSKTGYFITEIDLPGTSNALLECTAQTGSLEESTPEYFSAEYKATISERKDGYAVTIGKNSQLFMSNTLDDFYGDTLLTMTQIGEVKNYINTTYTSIQTARYNNKLAAYQTQLAGQLGHVLTEQELAQSEEYVKNNLFVEVPYIFVLVPSALTLYSDLAPDDVVTETHSTRYSQIVKALKETSATVIDMKEIFADHLNDNYPIYGKTDSYWTEYGAYLAYREIMNIVDDEFSMASARPLSDFTVETKSILGGDMVGYLYLDRETIKEQTVTLTPKFTIPFTYNIYNEEDDHTLSFSTNEDEVVSFITKRNISNEKEKVNGERWPNVLILRDEWSAQLYTMLGERFNGVMYAQGYQTGTKIEATAANPFQPRIIDINYIKTALQPDYVVVI